MIKTYDVDIFERLKVPENRIYDLMGIPISGRVQVYAINEKCNRISITSVENINNFIYIPDEFEIGSEIEIEYSYYTEGDEEKQMTKSDLKTGMKVILRNGREYTIALNTCYGDLLLSDEGTYCDMNYNDDLLYYGYCSLDITDIYKPTKTNHMNSKNRWEPIWKRNLVDEISLQEAVDMLKKVTGKNIKIIIQ